MARSKPSTFSSCTSKLESNYRLANATYYCHSLTASLTESENYTFLPISLWKFKQDVSRYAPSGEARCKPQGGCPTTGMNQTRKQTHTYAHAHTLMHSHRHPLGLWIAHRCGKANLCASVVLVLELHRQTDGKADRIDQHNRGD